MSLWRFANPNLFEQTASRTIPYCAWATALLLGAGLVWGAAFTSSDYVQGASVKIIFVHVPTALMAINAWFMMLVASLIWLIRRHHVSALAARAAAPVGAALTLAAIVTGAIWGKPMWGTWWAWDPRLTSVLILFFFYVGYIALWNSIEDREQAADVTSMVCLVGTVFAVLSRYAVFFLGPRTPSRINAFARQRDEHPQFLLLPSAGLHRRLRAAVHHACAAQDAD